MTKTLCRRLARNISIVALATAITITTSGIATAASTEIHYAPVENLERIDVELIATARLSIDAVAYSLTDWPVIQALVDAQQRGVAVRIVLDPSQRHAYERLAELADSIKIKRAGPLMHLKAYAIDGAVLRTGSANLSPSGLKQQDNDLIVIREPHAAATFEDRFERVWDAAHPLYEYSKAVAAMEPLAPGETASAAAGPNGCAIKGNINRKGERIYHLPGERGYDRVTMPQASRKRWFCSIEEAEAAGWRGVGH